MFQRFTDRARKAMVLANQEAKLRNYQYVGTEHILLGIIKGKCDRACAILENLGVSLEDIRLKLEGIMEKLEPNMVFMGNLPQISPAKIAIEYAIAEAEDMGYIFVDTDHILLGLLRRYRNNITGKYEDTPAQKVLHSLGVTYKKVQVEVKGDKIKGDKIRRNTKNTIRKIRKKARVLDESEEKSIKCEIFIINKTYATETQRVQRLITEFLNGKKLEYVVQSSTGNTTFITIFYREI